MKKALITGLTGQDGSYLAELLLEKGYEVHGLVRRNSTPSMERINHVLEKIKIIQGDIGDTSSLFHALKTIEPDEVYHLAAMSFVPQSWTEPVSTGNITGLGTARLLEAIRKSDLDTKFYQASSSEMFGQVQEVPQTEKTAFYPRSPYGVAKVYAYWLTVNYRESYGMFACNGILFNHESPRRGYEFVTRKITNAVARIKLGLQNELRLGNLDAKRDWGYSGDYVRMMWMMLNHKKPDDYVISTGKAHSVREFVEEAFNCAGVKDWQKYVKTDKRLLRPAEVNLLIGDSSKAKRVLGWEPKVDFKQLVEIMVKSDLESQKENAKRILEK
ncbi:MAG: GDP-mannose 4,6-dehydratase [Nanoarchaeota archaeon]|nr:GDP-mannose 4,6-dehydratase [Nanoarchaeota archaeon]